MEKQLLTLLDNENSQQQYRYLLLDTLTSVSEIDLITINNIKEILGEEAVTTVIRPELAHDLASCPKLITLAKPQQSLQKRLLHFSVIEAKAEILQSKRYVCGWLVSTLPPDVIAEQIVNIGRFIAKQCQMSFIPFYEPFRLELLQESNRICPEWLAEALNCFTYYCYPTVERTVNVIENINYKMDSFNIFLVEEAKFYQKEIKSIYALYIAWHDLTEYSAQAHHKTLYDIAAIYYQSYQLGLTAINDRHIYTLMSLRYGKLTQNAQLKTAIETARSEPGTLSEQFKQLDKRVFQGLTK
jgi:hypothetical protein